MLCKFFLFVCCWKENKRFDFFLGIVIDFIVKNGCILIFNFYLKSICLDLEWEFNFLIVEILIFNSLIDG